MGCDPPGENPQDTVSTVVVDDATIRLQRGPSGTTSRKRRAVDGFRAFLRCTRRPDVVAGESLLQKVRKLVMVRCMLRAEWVAGPPGSVSGVFRPCRDAVKSRGADWPTGRGADSAPPELLTKHAPQATTQTTTPISGSVKLGCLQRRQQTALIRWRRVLDPGWRPDTSRSCVFDRQPVSSVDSPNRWTPARLSAETRVPVAGSDG